MYGLTECKRVCYLEPELVDIKQSLSEKQYPEQKYFCYLLKENLSHRGNREFYISAALMSCLGYWHKEELSREMLRARQSAWGKNLMFK